jgi:hypothetical protein
LYYKHGFIYIYDLLLEERFLLDLLPPLTLAADPPNLTLLPPRLDLLRLDLPPVVVFAIGDNLEKSGKRDDILVYTLNILKKTK